MYWNGKHQVLNLEKSSCRFSKPFLHQNLPCPLIVWPDPQRKAQIQLQHSFDVSTGRWGVGGLQEDTVSIAEEGPADLAEHSPTSIRGDNTALGDVGVEAEDLRGIAS